MVARTTRLGDPAPDLDRSTAEDLATHDRMAGGNDRPRLGRTAPGFLRVLRAGAIRLEAVHTPGELLPDDVAQALDDGAGAAGADGVITVDLR